ncbi:hypothetical protein BS78_07G035400 [Paspalum vaginatum]|nr:hypothetical protein BS78_07G035400 [Paspalum vaginatum]
MTARTRCVGSARPSRCRMPRPARPRWVGSARAPSPCSRAAMTASRASPSTAGTLRQAFGPPCRGRPRAGRSGVAQRRLPGGAAAATKPAPALPVACAITDGQPRARDNFLASPSIAGDWNEIFGNLLHWTGRLHTLSFKKASATGGLKHCSFIQAASGFACIRFCRSSCYPHKSQPGCLLQSGNH